MLQDKIVALIVPTIEDMGYMLWGCEYLAQGKHSLLRIYIDKENGIGVEDCERVSRQVSAILDVEDPISGNYFLEVSSPGIPRPLFYTWQYQHYIGREISLKLYQPISGKRKVKGTVLAVTDNLVTLQVIDETLEFQFSNIVKANLIE